ncbi:polysaccharide lyase [Pendulispora albinea]|uniref:Polysaccharide lyase n=1 Tax=Pendulispora albinea TaxID=2741071 RepID=A0ABZ2LVS5_9BACT
MFATKPHPTISPIPPSAFACIALPLVLIQGCSADASEREDDSTISALDRASTSAATPDDHSSSADADPDVRNLDPSTAEPLDPDPSTAAAAAAPQWAGQFAGFRSSSWQSAWGYTSQGSWGLGQLSAVSDSSAPGGGSALRVFYGKGSSANSCTNCPNPGGGQFHTKLSSLGSAGSTMANSKTLDLKYNVKFPSGWSFGKGGKLPGLYGGNIGEASGGNHGWGWSTRFMWRNHGGAPNAGEVYLYTPSNAGPSGYGVDYFGNWKWTADGKWHTVEQLVNRSTGDVTVWFDGKQVLAEPGIAKGISNIPFSGIFFSTFFGGHDTSWGPSVSEYAYFANFSLSTGIQH